MSNKSTTRRQFLKVMGAAAGASAAAGILAGCGGSNTSSPESGQSSSTRYFMNFEAANKEQWARIPADHKKGTLVSEKDWYKILGDVPKEPIIIAGFKGGWGESWIDTIIASLKADFPNIQIEKDFDPRIWEKMKPRLVAGEVPDWMYWVIGPWGGEWRKAVDEKIMVPCDFLLDVEAFGVAGKRVTELIRPGVLEAANANITTGQWSMPMSLSVHGIYYNVDMFEKNGWKPPDQLTFEEFLEQNKKIKAAGIPPFTYPGKYPGYWGSFLTALWYKKAGDKAFCDMDNLVPGAFLNPDLVWGLEQVQSFFKNDWIYPGSDALSHTESQQVFVDGKAAMIPNASWMPNEQRETTPAGFRMALSGVPAPSDAKGFKDAIIQDRGNSELQVGNGKNPLWGMEVMRRIYSPLVQRIWAEEIGSTNAMIEVVKNVKSTPEWESAARLIERAKGHQIVLNYGTWYPEFGKKWNDSFGDIVTGKIPPVEALDFLERSAQMIRDNPDIEKITRKCEG